MGRGAADETENPVLLYRIALTLAAPFLALVLARRLWRGEETRADLAQRLGLGAPRPKGPALWIHGASNGEFTAAQGLIVALARAHPAITLVATANTPSARAMLQGWALPHLEVRLAPLDWRLCLRAFLSRANPAGLLMLESELWPNRLALLRAKGLPVAVVSARLSTRSARRWSRMPRFGQRLLSGVAMLSAQSEESAARFLAAGLRPEALAPTAMLKASVALPPPDREALAALAPLFPRGDTVLAASTHEGEEAQVAAAFAAARRDRPALRLIVAPRHPARGAAVSRLLSEAGLAHTRRSTGGGPDPSQPVYLADTLGEMPLWYSLAGTCFVGGSLAAKGGHTPYEPAQFGCALLHGPDTANFAEAYAALADAAAALSVADGDELARALAGLDADRAAALGERARATLGTAAANGAVDDLRRRISELFDLD